MGPSSFFFANVMRLFSLFPFYVNERKKNVPYVQQCRGLLPPPPLGMGMEWVQRELK